MTPPDQGASEQHHPSCLHWKGINECDCELSYKDRGDGVMESERRDDFPRELEPLPKEGYVKLPTTEDGPE